MEASPHAPQLWGCMLALPRWGYETRWNRWTGSGIVTARCGRCGTIEWWRSRWEPWL